MNRRSFTRAVTCSAVMAAGTARAQPAAKVRRVGFLGANTPEAAGHLAAAFVARLGELGWVEGRNLSIDYRWAGGRAEKFRGLAAELVAAQAEVIVSSGNAPAIAAHEVTRTVPIVLASSGNLVAAGLAQSLARPGGNVTGMTFANDELVGKRLQLLREIVPGLARVAVLRNPLGSPSELAALRAVAGEIGVGLDLLDFHGPADLERLSKAFESSPIKAMLVVSDPLVFTHRVAINAFALRQRLPTMNGLREYAADGGLLSYGPDFIALWRRAAEYVDKILKGVRPEELPIEQPTKFQTVVNLKTAKALGIRVPQTMLLRADEVIE